MRDEARGSGLAKRLIVYPIHQLLNGSQRMRLPRSADAVTAAATISIFWISTVLEPLPRCALLGRSGQPHGGVSKMTIRKAEKTLQDLFLDGVKDVYYAEKKIVKTLPKMTKAATSPDIKAAFEKHLAETEGHVERLEQVFELLGKPARGKTCPAIDGILEEGAEVMDEYKGTAALDAALVASAQAVEHYEIARYGTLATWAKELDITDAAELLKATLGEEEATDEALSALGEGGANQRAVAQAA